MCILGLKGLSCIFNSFLWRKSIQEQIYSSFLILEPVSKGINPFAPGDFAEKRDLKLVEWFTGHCHAIKS